MITNKKTTKNRGESGNALFLILIAVALFAALSYAITQSGKGGGSVTQQTNLITAGQVTELPADVRSAAARMMVTGVSATSITFTGTGTATDVFDQVTGGGGATDVPPPSAACATASDCTAGWTYVKAGTAANGFFVEGAGSNGTNGGLAVAGLMGAGGVAPAVCQAIQKGLGFASPYAPPTQHAGTVAFANAAVAITVGGAANTISSGTGTSADTLWGQDFACFKNTGGLYAYYGVLIDQ